MPGTDGERTAALVRAARCGDARAFAGLVRAYQDLAVAYATSLLGDYHLAEDAAQEAFLEAYRELPSLREPAAFPGWLRTIVFKRCDRMTRRRRHRTTGLDAALAVASPAPSPHETLELRETQASVRRAIAALSEAERQVVLLYYMGDHSQAAIAEFLGVTANTVKTRLYAARKRLREHMSEIERGLEATRPSGDPEFASRVERLIRPEELKRDEPLVWSPGLGTDVWEMFRAAITGEVETVRRLLEKDPSLVRSTHEYRTPLSFAVRENQLEVAALLLERGADPVSSGSQDTLLQIARDRGYERMGRLLESALAAPRGESPRGAAVAAAIRGRDREEVRRLLDADPELVHARDERTNQPIHWAVMTRQIDLIDELLARGADLEAQRADGARPIQLTNGDYSYRGWRDVPADTPASPAEVLAHLRARGASCDLCTAAYIGDLERVRELVDRDPSLANRPSDYVTYYPCSGTPLRNAAAGGHLEIVRLLLERGADPNLPEEGIAPRGHALHAAVGNGHLEIARLLLERGAHPNVEIESSGDTLSTALRRSDREMVDLLASYGAARSVPLLAYYGDVLTAAAVFAANPALADDPGALAYAAAEGHEPFVRLMLRYRPGLAARITWSGPANVVGARTRELNELLFEHGMDPSRPDWLRITPLHHLARKGDVETAEVFIDHGADLNARDEEYRSTPLGYAARFGKVAMVELLLRRGARPSLPDDPPWATPLAWARRRGHREVVELLERHGRAGAPAAPAPTLSRSKPSPGERYPIP